MSGHPFSNPSILDHRSSFGNADVPVGSIHHPETRNIATGPAPPGPVDYLMDAVGVSIRTYVPAYVNTVLGRDGDKYKEVLKAIVWSVAKGMAKNALISFGVGTGAAVVSTLAGAPEVAPAAFTGSAKATWVFLTAYDLFRAAGKISMAVKVAAQAVQQAYQQFRQAAKLAYYSQGNKHKIDQAARQMAPVLAALGAIILLIAVIILLHKGIKALGKRIDKLVAGWAGKMRYLSSKAVNSYVSFLQRTFFKKQMTYWEWMQKTGLGQPDLVRFSEFCKSQGWTIALRQRSTSALRWMNQGVAKPMGVGFKTARTGRYKGIVVLLQKYLKAPMDAKYGGNGLKHLSNLLRSGYRVRAGNQFLQYDKADDVVRIIQGGRSVRVIAGDTLDDAVGQGMKEIYKVSSEPLLVTNANKVVYSDVDFAAVIARGKALCHTSNQSPALRSLMNRRLFGGAEQMQHGTAANYSVIKAGKDIPYKAGLDEMFPVCLPDGRWTLMNFDQFKSFCELWGIGEHLFKLK